MNAIIMLWRDYQTRTAELESGESKFFSPRRTQHAFPLSTTRSLSLSLAFMEMVARLMGGPGFYGASAIQI
jgi:hypothetical protein